MNIFKRKNKKAANPAVTCMNDILERYLPGYYHRDDVARYLDLDAYLTGEKSEKPENTAIFVEFNDLQNKLYFEAVKCWRMQKNNYICSMNMKREIGKMLIDMAKLIFGGVILAGIMRQDLAPVAIFTIGGTTTAFFGLGGLYLLWLADKNNNVKNK